VQPLCLCGGVCAALAAQGQSRRTALAVAPQSRAHAVGARACAASAHTRPPAARRAHGVVCAKATPITVMRSPLSSHAALDWPLARRVVVERG
jgi:hypothetical protein